MVRGKARTRSDNLLIVALTAAISELKEKRGSDMNKWAWGDVHTATFRHPLGVDAQASALFNIGPIARDGYALTPLSTAGPA